MHEEQIAEVSGQLKDAIGSTTLRQLGDESGFVIRERAIIADRFVPSLIKSQV